MEDLVSGKPIGIEQGMDVLNRSLKVEVLAANAMFGEIIRLDRAFSLVLGAKVYRDSVLPNSHLNHTQRQGLRLGIFSKYTNRPILFPFARGASIRTCVLSKNAA